MPLSFNVTRRELELGTADSVTGWYARNWTESTIEMIIVDRGGTQIALPAGAYVRLDALGMSADPVVEGDEIETDDGRVYEVKAIKEVWGPGDNFVRRDCDMVKLPLHGLTYTDTTPSVEDARYRTKDYWDTYIVLANLNDHPFIVAYADPDYPLLRVFKTKEIDIVFAVGQPNSTPLLGHTQAAYGYEEHVPTHVQTLDTQLQWLAEAELRRITETYPEGSQRSLERRATHDRWLGSTRLYDTEFILSYRRDKT